MKTTYEPCHVDGQYLFNVGKARIHAGSNKTDYKGFGLIINISGFSYQKSIATGTNGADNICPEFLCMTQHPDNPPELAIDWPDGGVPQLRRKDWRRLVSDLEKFDGKVLIHCFGGHGRTGTLLVILASLSNAIQGDIVKALRELYCEDIVETQRQIDYLKQKIQVKTNAGPTRIPLPPITSNYHYDSVRGREGGATVYVEVNGEWVPQEWADYQSNKGVELPAKTDNEGTYQCIQCQRLKVPSLFFQKFQNRTGVCWTCNQAEYLKKYGKGGDIYP